MKLKKILALILAVAMCACLFAISPVVNANEAQGAVWVVRDPNGYRSSSSVIPPEGYERVTANALRTTDLVTAQKYDMTENTLVLNGLNIGKGTTGDWFNIVFATTVKAATSKTNVENGIMSLMFKTTSTSLQVYKFDGNWNSFATVPLADEYEIGYIKTGSKYRFHINNYYFEEDATGYGAKQETEGGSYITFGAGHSFSANAKIMNNDSTQSRWVMFVGESGKQHVYDANGKIATDMAGTSISVNPSRAVSSLSRYNWLENSLVIDNATFSTDGTWNYFCIDSTRTRSTSPVSSATRFGFFATAVTKTNEDGSKEITDIKFSITADPNAAAITAPVADKYIIHISKVGSKYYLYVNEKRKEITSTDFITNAGYENAYITFYSANRLTGDFKVVKNDSLTDVWYTSKGTRLASGNNVHVTASNTVSSIGRYDLLRGGKISFTNVEFTTNTAKYAIIEVATYAHGDWAASSSSIARLAIAFKPTEVVDGKVTKVGVYYLPGAYESLGTIDVTETTDFTFNFAVEGGKYYLYINGVQMKYKSKFDEYGNAGILQNCYVNIKAQDYFKATTEYVSSPWNQVGKDAVVSWSAGESDTIVKDVVLADDGHIRYKNKFDVRKSTVVIDGLAIGEASPSATVDPNNFNKSATLIFTKSSAVGTPVIASEESITFFFLHVKDEEQNIEHIKVYNVGTDGGWKSIGNVPVADSYKINVVYSANNKYTLKVNDTVLNTIQNKAAENFFGKGINDAYVLVGAQETTVTADKISFVEDEMIVGDVSGDDVRDILDMVMIERGMANDAPSADADQNGEVGNDDVDAIRKIWFLGGLNGYTYIQ